MYTSALDGGAFPTGSTVSRPKPLGTLVVATVEATVEIVEVEVADVVGAAEAIGAAVVSVVEVGASDELGVGA